MLLTSHYLDEVEHLADRVGVLRNGRLIAEGSPGELAATIGDTTVWFRLPAGVALSEIAHLLDGDVSCVDEPNGVAVTTAKPTAALRTLTGCRRSSAATSSTDWRSTDLPRGSLPDARPRRSRNG